MQAGRERGREVRVKGKEWRNWSTNQLVNQFAHWPNKHA